MDVHINEKYISLYRDTKDLNDGKNCKPGTNMILKWNLFDTTICIL